MQALRQTREVRSFFFFFGRAFSRPPRWLISFFSFQQDSHDGGVDVYFLLRTSLVVLLSGKAAVCAYAVVRWASGAVSDLPESEGLYKLEAG